jgi:predicted CopG family antitoxin
MDNPIVEKQRQQNKPIGVSFDNYAILNQMRRQKPGLKEFESFNDVITRLLSGVRKNDP